MFTLPSLTPFTHRPFVCVAMPNLRSRKQRELAKDSGKPESPLQTLESDRKQPKRAAASRSRAASVKSQQSDTSKISKGPGKRTRSRQPGRPRKRNKTEPSDDEEVEGKPLYVEEEHEEKLKEAAAEEQRRPQTRRGGKRKLGENVVIQEDDGREPSETSVSDDDSKRIRLASEQPDVTESQEESEVAVSQGALPDIREESEDSASNVNTETEDATAAAQMSQAEDIPSEPPLSDVPNTVIYPDIATEAQTLLAEADETVTSTSHDIISDETQRIQPQIEHALTDASHELNADEAQPTSSIVEQTVTETSEEVTTTENQDSQSALGQSVTQTSYEVIPDEAEHATHHVEQTIINTTQEVITIEDDEDDDDDDDTDTDTSTESETTPIPRHTSTADVTSTPAPSYPPINAADATYPPVGVATPVSSHLQSENAPMLLYPDLAETITSPHTTVGAVTQYLSSTPEQDEVQSSAETSDAYAVQQVPEPLDSASEHSVPSPTSHLPHLSTTSSHADALHSGPLEGGTVQSGDSSDVVDGEASRDDDHAYIQDAAMSAPQNVSPASHAASSSSSSSVSASEYVDAVETHGPRAPAPPLSPTPPILLGESVTTPPIRGHSDLWPEEQHTSLPPLRLGSPLSHPTSGSGDNSEARNSKPPPASSPSPLPDYESDDDSEALGCQCYDRSGTSPCCDIHDSSIRGGPQDLSTPLPSTYATDILATGLPTTSQGATSPIYTPTQVSRPEVTGRTDKPWNPTLGRSKPFMQQSMTSSSSKDPVPSSPHTPLSTTLLQGDPTPEGGSPLPVSEEARPGLDNGRSLASDGSSSVITQVRHGGLEAANTSPRVKQEPIEQEVDLQTVPLASHPSAGEAESSDSEDMRIDSKKLSSRLADTSNLQFSIGHPVAAGAEALGAPYFIRDSRQPEQNRNVKAFQATWVQKHPDELPTEMVGRAPDALHLARAQEILDVAKADLWNPTFSDAKTNALQLAIDNTQQMYNKLQEQATIVKPRDFFTASMSEEERSNTRNVHTKGKRTHPDAANEKFESRTAKRARLGRGAGVPPAKNSRVRHLLKETFMDLPKTTEDRLREMETTDKLNELASRVRSNMASEAEKSQKVEMEQQLKLLRKDHVDSVMERFLNEAVEENRIPAGITPDEVYAVLDEVEKERKEAQEADRQKRRAKRQAERAARGKASGAGPSGRSQSMRAPAAHTLQAQDPVAASEAAHTTAGAPPKTPVRRPWTLRNFIPSSVGRVFGTASQGRAPEQDAPKSPSDDDMDTDSDNDEPLKENTQVIGRKRPHKEEHSKYEKEVKALLGPSDYKPEFPKNILAQFEGHLKAQVEARVQEELAEALKKKQEEWDKQWAKELEAKWEDKRLEWKRSRRLPDNHIHREDEDVSGIGLGEDFDNFSSGASSPEEDTVNVARAQRRKTNTGQARDVGQPSILRYLRTPPGSRLDNPDMAEWRTKRGGPAYTTPRAETRPAGGQPAKEPGTPTMEQWLRGLGYSDEEIQSAQAKHGNFGRVVRENSPELPFNALTDIPEGVDTTGVDMVDLDPDDIRNLRLGKVPPVLQAQRERNLRRDLQAHPGTYVPSSGPRAGQYVDVDDLTEEEKTPTYWAEQQIRYEEAQKRVHNMSPSERAAFHRHCGEKFERRQAAQREKANADYLAEIDRDMEAERQAPGYDPTRPAEGLDLGGRAESSGAAAQVKPDAQQPAPRVNIFVQAGTPMTNPFAKPPQPPAPSAPKSADAPNKASSTSTGSPQKESVPSTLMPGGRQALLKARHEQAMRTGKDIFGRPYDPSTYKEDSDLSAEPASGPAAASNKGQANAPSQPKQHQQTSKIFGAPDSAPAQGKETQSVKAPQATAEVADNREAPNSSTGSSSGDGQSYGTPCPTLANLSATGSSSSGAQSVDGTQQAKTDAKGQAAPEKPSVSFAPNVTDTPTVNQQSPRKSILKSSKPAAHGLAPPPPSGLRSSVTMQPSVVDEEEQPISPSKLDEASSYFLKKHFGRETANPPSQARPVMEEAEPVERESGPFGKNPRAKGQTSPVKATSGPDKPVSTSPEKKTGFSALPSTQKGLFPTRRGEEKRAAHGKSMQNDLTASKSWEPSKTSLKQIKEMGNTSESSDPDSTSTPAASLTSASPTKSPFVFSSTSGAQNAPSLQPASQPAFMPSTSTMAFTGKGSSNLQPASQSIGAAVDKPPYISKSPLDESSLATSASVPPSSPRPAPAALPGQKPLAAINDTEQSAQHPFLGQGQKGQEVTSGPLFSSSQRTDFKATQQAKSKTFVGLAADSASDSDDASATKLPGAGLFGSTPAKGPLSKSGTFPSSTTPAGAPTMKSGDQSAKRLPGEGLFGSTLADAPSPSESRPSTPVQFNFEPRKLPDDLDLRKLAEAPEAKTAPRNSSEDDSEPEDETEDTATGKRKIDLSVPFGKYSVSLPGATEEAQTPEVSTEEVPTSAGSGEDPGMESASGAETGEEAGTSADDESDDDAAAKLAEELAAGRASLRGIEFPEAAKEASDDHMALWFTHQMQSMMGCQDAR